jgi:hypothetical protein
MMMHIMLPVTEVLQAFFEEEHWQVASRASVSYGWSRDQP